MEGKSKSAGAPYARTYFNCYKGVFGIAFAEAIMQFRKIGLNLVSKSALENNQFLWFEITIF